MSRPTVAQTSKKERTLAARPSNLIRTTGRPAGIARGHRILSNIQATLNEAQNGCTRVDSSQASTSHAEKQQQILKAEENCSVEDLISKFRSFSTNRHVSEKQMRRCFVHMIWASYQYKY